MLSFEVKKTYGARVALDCATEIEEGGVTALIGQNGDGKTTFLSALAGLIRFEGRIDGLKGKNVGLMPQTSYAFDMSARRNVLLGIPRKARATKAGRESARAIVDGLMAATGLAALARKNATRLSGGETQKVALCRVLAARHDILLLDEPTSAMDVASAKAAERMLEEYREAHNPTIVVATHSISQALRIADRAIVLRSGKIVGDGKPSEALADPAIRFW